MSWLRRGAQAFRALVMRRRLEREMREEMEQHLERSVERLVGRGMTQAAAERAAHREFGNIDYLREQARDARGARWLETLLADLRYGARQLMQAPLLSATMIFVLALGIGSNVALFSVLDGYVNRPGPAIPPSEGLVRVRGLVDLENGRTITREALSYPEYLAYAQRGDVLAASAAYHRNYGVADVGGGERMSFPATIHFVTPEYFHVLGVRPALGAGLPAAGTSEVGDAVVISDVLWRTHYGADSSVIGRPLRVNGHVLTIAGVAPRQFKGTSWHSGTNSVWVPVSAMQTVLNSGPGVLTHVDSTRFDVIARLATGITSSDATSRLQPIPNAFRSGWLEDRPVGVDVVPLRVYNEHSSSDILLGAAAGGLICLLILLVTCTNVAGLQLGRALTRRREIAVRLSLGAGRGRIVRQLVTESVVAALVAGALAILVIRVLVVLLPGYPPDVDVVVSYRAALFACTFALLTGIGFGLAPALHATRVAVGDVLKDASASISGPRTRLQGGLLVAQVAFTQPLLILVAVSLVTVTREARDAADRPELERLVRLSVDFTTPTPPEQMPALLRPVEDVLRGTPGVAGVVSSAGYGTRLHLQVHPDDQLTGTRSDAMRVRADIISPGYLDVMRIPLLRGMDVPESTAVTEASVNSSNDTQRKLARAEMEELAVVIGDDLARQLWGSADPIGRRFVPAAGSGSVGITRAYRVVGVVDHTIAGTSESGGMLRIYLENSFPIRSWLIRTHLPAATLIPELQRAVTETAPMLAVTRIETLAADAARERRQAMQVIALAGAGGAITLMLSAVGLFAIVARAVTMRLREIGIRTALGATTGSVVRLFFGRGVRLAAVGVLLGLPISVYLIHVATQGDLDRPGATALFAAGPVALIVLLVAGVASWLPARRAAGTDPVRALRVD